LRVERVNPLAEGLMSVALLFVHTQESLRERRQLVRAEAQSLHLLSERVRFAEVSADVDIEAFELLDLAVAVRLLGDEDAHEPEVRELVTRARVRAAVHVDAERLVEIGHALLELAVEPVAPRLRLDDRELAEFDAGARHHPAAER